MLNNETTANDTHPGQTLRVLLCDTTGNMMIIGRVGVPTFSYIIVGNDPTHGVEYSEENLMIG